MNFSAAWSSSWVLTPGRTFPASRLIVLTRMSPAAAIRSISSGLFLMIIGAPPISYVLFEAKRRDHRSDVIVDLSRIAGSVDALEQPTFLVVADQRLGLIVVGREPVLDHLGLVVLTLDQAGAVLIA